MKDATKVTIEQLAARQAHEANRRFCELLGDDSQPRWEDAPQWQQDSAVAGVLAVSDGTAKTPEESHEGWLAQKREDGWVYGPVKDPETKQHPCMVPYAKLPPEQRFKDTLFLEVVRGMLVGHGNGSLGANADRT